MGSPQSVTRELNSLIPAWLDIGRAVSNRGDHLPRMASPGAVSSTYQTYLRFDDQAHGPSHVERERGAAGTWDTLCDKGGETDT
jgi:hypothetical protein